jgi:hypothetical protein
LATISKEEEHYPAAPLTPKKKMPVRGALQNRAVD